jgi:hypothetical protein
MRSRSIDTVPAAPYEIESLDELKDFLHLAMKIEHATIPPYLTALYSIKPGTNQDVSNILRVIVVEEMLHLTFAANLLNAIGGSPNLNAQGFVPSYPTFLPGGEEDFKIHLLPLCPESLRTFLDIERPTMPSSADQGLVRRRYKAGSALLGVHPRRPELRFYSIGVFYSAIERGFQRLEEEARSERKTIFVSATDDSRQVGAEQFYSGGGKLFEVTDLDTACLAIRKIIEQGEGVTDKLRDGQGELAHYYRFEQIDKRRYYLPDDNQPGSPSGPTFEVDWSSVYLVGRDVKLKDMLPDAELHAAGVAFNNDYAAFLKVLTDAYNGKPDLIADAVPMMFTIRNRMYELMRNPLPGRDENAGPTFELYALTAGEAQS